MSELLATFGIEKIEKSKTQTQKKFKYYITRIIFVVWFCMWIFAISRAIKISSKTKPLPIQLLFATISPMLYITYSYTIGK